MTAGPPRVPDRRRGTGAFAAAPLASPIVLVLRPGVLSPARNAGAGDARIA